MKKWWAILFFFAANFIFAQTTDFVHVTATPGNQRYMDIDVLDSTLLLLGSNDKGIELLETTNAGEVIRSARTFDPDTTFNPFQLIKSTSGDYFVAAEKNTQGNSSSALFKVRPNLSLQLFATLQQDSTSQIVNACQEYENSIYCTGIFSSPDMTFGNDFWLTKIDRNGGVVWSYHYGDPDFNEVASSLVIIDDRIYVFGDKNKADFSYSPYHAVLDTNGFFFTDTKPDWPYNGGVKASCLTDDAIYITGESSTPTSSWFDIYLEKWDLQGNRIWRKLIPQTDRSETGFDIKFKNGQLYLTGYSHNHVLDNTDMHISVLDTAGSLLETTQYNLGSVDIGYRIGFSESGVYAVGSGTDPLGNGTDYMMAFQNMAPTEIPEVESPPMKIRTSYGGKVSIVFQKPNQRGRVEVFTVCGQKYIEQEVNSQEVNFRMSQKGIYIIRYTHGSTTQTEKISLY